VRVTQSTKHWGVVSHHEVHDAITMMRMQSSHRTRSITIGSPYHVLGTRNTFTSSLTVKSEESSNQTTIGICPSNFIWTLLGVSRQSRLKAADNSPEDLEYCPERAEKSGLISKTLGDCRLTSYPQFAPLRQSRRASTLAQRFGKHLLRTAYIPTLSVGSLRLQ
jgi:hypothetical protein